MVGAATTGSLVNGTPFLAADIGGTHARLALVRAGSAGRSVEVLAFRKYDCTDHPSLVDFIADFLAAHNAGGVDHGVVASAGYALDDGTVITTNLPFKQWSTIFPGAACVVAMVDRFVQHCHVMDIEGESWRPKDSEPPPPRTRAKPRKR